MKSILAATALTCLCLQPAPASAQSQRNCGPRQVVLDRLADGYGESRQSAGLAANRQLVEVFAAPDTGTWTITVTNPEGLTCLVASGTAYERLDEALAPAGSDS